MVMHKWILKGCFALNGCVAQKYSGWPAFWKCVRDLAPFSKFLEAALYGLSCRHGVKPPLTHSLTVY